MADEGIFYVYRHTSPNGKVYIGITKQNPIQRWQNGKGYRRNPRFYRAIEKYGWDAFSHEVIYSGLTKEQATEQEQELIKLHNATDYEYGYNNSIGGECGSLGATLSENTRAKMSNSRKGEKNHFFGKHHTEETKAKLSRANKGKPCCWKGKKLTEEHKKKVSENHADFRGGKHGSAIKVMCVETGVVYEAISVASRETGICDDSISKVIRGVMQRAGGYHWVKYAGGKNGD